VCGSKSESDLLKELEEWVGWTSSGHAKTVEQRIKAGRCPGCGASEFHPAHAEKILRPYRQEKARRRQVLRWVGRHSSAPARIAGTRIKERLANHECPGCGKSGSAHPKCVKGIVSSELGEYVLTANELKEQRSIYDSQGRNRNGIRYRADGSRIWQGDKDW
jgi:hypothetical protein